MPAFVSPIANFFSAGDTAEVAAVSGSQGQAAALLEEYTAGAKIVLEIGDSFCEEYDEVEAVEAVIEHVFQPFTQSVVLKVSYKLYGQQKKAILKLYDRRGAKGFRTANHAVHDEWTPEREREYQAYMQADYNDEIKERAIAFIDQNRGEAFFGAHAPFDSGNQQQAALLFREAVFSVGIKYMMDREIEVYGALEPLQGTIVPRLYTTVSYYHPQSSGNYDEGFTSVGGLLLEYIDGTELVELFASGEIPVSQHQRIGDLAIAAVNEISACGVLNCDVSTRNAIVRRDEMDEYSVVIYDFGIARTRNEYESDDAWLEIKWACMEVDKMGLELVDVANYEYDCVKPYDDKELNGDSATQLMREQQAYYKQCFFDSWQRNPQMALIAS